MSAFPELAGEAYINLESFKRDGTGVRTPVWFAEHEGALYIYTLANAYKVKRIRRNPQVRVIACDFRGNPRPGASWRAAVARIEDPSGTALGHRVLNQKYGWKKRIGDLFSARLMRRKRAVISIRPA
jgi:PPOX class probable F420-dependent enzyme